MFEEYGDAEGEGEGGAVGSFFESDDGLAGDADLVGEVLLGHADFLLPELPDVVLERGF